VVCTQSSSGGALDLTNSQMESLEMKVYTIKQKSTGTGTIYDIASDQFDRKIKFRSGTRYAVVLAAYYGCNLYTTHKTEDSAITQSKKTSDAHIVMDSEGTIYLVDGDSLVACNRC
jgi:hypothetical protein